MTYESAFGVKRLLDTTTESLHALAALGVGTGNWDDIIVFLTVQKLSPQTHMLWEEACSKLTELPTFKQLQTFLESRFRTLEVVNAEVNKYKNNVNGRNFASNRPTNSKTLHVHSSASCPACSKNHFVLKCPKFNNMTPAERLSTIKSSSSCFNCLSPSHTTPRCTTRTTCNTCNRKHHTLLHGGWENVPSESPGNTSATPVTSSNRTTPNPFSQPSNASLNSSTSNNLTSLFVSNTRTQVLTATALIKTRSTSGGTIHLRALLDQGSETSFITENAVQLLNLERSNINGNIT